MSESDRPLLSVRDIHTFIGQYHILQGVSLSVQAGGVTAILGRNGAGKTTTLRTIIGLNKASQGSVHFQGEGIHGRRAYDVARLGIGYVPEHRAIFKDLTVAENMKIAERQPGDLAARLDFIFSIFPDLKRLFNWPGGQLSGGQQQMLAIARALVPTNRLLLIDEPSEGLAPVIIEQMIAAIQQLRDEATVVLVEQNFRVARTLADRYVIIENGKSVHAGAMAALVDDPALINRFLGAA